MILVLYPQGDQGSPLLCKSDTSWFQVAAVTMSGSKSARADVQVFSKTSRFGSFIEKTVEDLPSPAADLTGNSPRVSASLFLSFTVPITSVFLLSLSGVVGG